MLGASHCPILKPRFQNVHVLRYEEVSSLNVLFFRIRDVAVPVPINKINT